MSPVHHFNFKIVGTSVTRDYDANSNFTISEFINFIKEKVLSDNQINDMGIENFEFVPLYSYSESAVGQRSEDAPALQPTDDLLPTICNTNNKPTFFYIRPIPPVVPMEIDDLLNVQPTTTNITMATCVICMTNLREVAFTPCGHLCICCTCNENPTVIVCPICRNPQSRSLEIFHP